MNDVGVVAGILARDLAVTANVRGQMALAARRAVGEDLCLAVAVAEGVAAMVAELDERGWLAIPDDRPAACA